MDKLIKRDGASLYSHNERVKKILKEEKIKELNNQYWDCNRETCLSNQYNEIECENCPITNHNIKKLKIR